MKRTRPQLRLIGAEAQERVGKASVTVASRDPFSEEIEALYLAGAGAGEVVVRDESANEAVRALDPGQRTKTTSFGTTSTTSIIPPLGYRFVSRSAQAFADGAHGALEALRRLVGGP